MGASDENQKLTAGVVHVWERRAGWSSFARLSLGVGCDRQAEEPKPPGQRRVRGRQGPKSGHTARNGSDASDTLNEVSPRVRDSITASNVAPRRSFGYQDAGRVNRKIISAVAATRGA